VLYIELALLGKWAVISGARDAVGVGEHSSTDAPARFDIDRNRLLLLFLSIQGLEGGVQRMFFGREDSILAPCIASYLVLR